MKILKIISSFVFLVLFFGLIFIYGKPSNPADIKYIKIAGQEVKIELALTPEEQTQGLSGRSGLGPNEGMLFVFDTPGKYSFWMKDMKFAIDIIWFTPSEGNEAGLAEDLRVVYVKKDARSESYPESFTPDEEAKYVLEVESGFADKYNLQVGDRVEFKY